MAKSSTPCRGAKALVNNATTKGRLTELGAIQYSHAEVAEDFGASEAELAAFFARWRPARDIFEQSVADARKRLRLAQFKLAEKSPTMAIFLGKQYLGQAARRELESSAQIAEDARAAAQRVHDKLAALAAAPSPPGDYRSGEEVGDE